jgi:hypothetical protein
MLTLATLRKLAKSKGYADADISTYDDGACTVARVIRRGDSVPYMQALHPSRQVAMRMLAMGLRALKVAPC